MKRIALVLIALAICLPLSGSLSGRLAVPAYTRTASAAQPLLDLVPASSILAIQVTDLDLRWGEIRGIPPIARLQDDLLDIAGIPNDHLPRLVGAEAVVFLARTGRRTPIAPIAILQPADPAGAENALRRVDGLAYRFGRGALWVGPASAEAFLDDCAREDSLGLAAVIRMDEIDRRLPRGGLIRGWINPPALATWAREASRETSAPMRWLEAILAAEMSAVRCAGFRRDLSDGEIVADAVVVYDESRLPAALFRLFDPGAASATLPSGFPSDALLTMAFRPEPAAWLPWAHYVSSNDPRGPMRNFAFWLNEFRHRYRRDLGRDLFGALGEHAWLLVAPDEASGKKEFAIVFELNETASFRATLDDFLAWLREMAWLESFGLLRPQYRMQSSGGLSTLRISFESISGRDEVLTIEIGDGHIVAGSSADVVRGAADWIKGWKVAPSGAPAGYGPPGAHGALLTGGAQLAVLCNSLLPEPADTRLRKALAESLREMGAFSAALRYEEGAIRLHGRLRLAGRY